MVWHVTREFAGFAEAGGVKDAVSGLALALARAGVGTTVVLPLYGFMTARTAGKPVVEFALPVPDQDKGYTIAEEWVSVFALEQEGVRFLLVDSPRFADKRDVYTYTAEDEAENQYKKKGTGHWDSHQMNVILQKSALETSFALDEIPRIFHCHDGHAAFLPALMREDRRLAGRFASSRAVLTIHNAGAGYHQEIWDMRFAQLLTGLEERVLRLGLSSKTVDPLFLAASYATLTTVSEQYARELLAEKDTELAGGLGRLLRERCVPLHGITNGVDPEPFDPRNPEATGLPFSFDPSSGDWEGKRKCRERLFDLLGVSGADRGRPLFSFIGRLTTQKGIDVLSGALSVLLTERDCPDFVVLGQGEANAENMFRRLAARHVDGKRLSFLPRYDPALAKLITAASDFILVPSSFEPCGLTDYHAQLMGAIPLVHKVGGLVKVRDGLTGFSYVEQTSASLLEAIRRCARLFKEDPGLLEDIRKRAFEEIFELHTWDKVAADGYLPLYRAVLAEG